MLEGKIYGLGVFWLIWCYETQGVGVILKEVLLFK